MKNLQKQIEIEAREYIYSPKYHTGLYTDVQIENLRHESFVDGANFVLSKWQESDRWIPVDEKLPEKHESVNVMLRDGTYTHSFLLEDGFWAYNVEPTHWRYKVAPESTASHKNEGISMSKPDLYKEIYSCAEPDNCFDCMWFNGEQCIRELLTEEDIQDILKGKIK